MAHITPQITTITRIVPQITIVSMIMGVILFLIILPFINLIWQNITAVGQVLAFIAGLWIASKFVW